MLCVLGYLLGEPDLGPFEFEFCRMSYLKTCCLTFLSAQEKLFLCGVDVFRLNFSHGEHEEKLDLIDKIRDIEDKYRLDPVHALHSSELKQRYVRIRLRIQCS